jgi:hypothetical protein
MKTMIKFPKIKQFRQVINDINHAAIITPEKDNAGFATFAYSIEEDLVNMMREVAVANKIDLKTFTISVYGEWAGTGIQKGVAISKLEKSFFVFGVKVSDTTNEDFDDYWIDSATFKIEEKRVFNILDFETYTVDVDFSMPQLSQNIFAEITQRVEEQCPVGKYFEIDGIGEGVVWTARYQNKYYRFKVKGQKHAVTKVRKLAKIDTEKLNSINEFVDYAVTENRMQQGIEKVFGDSMAIDRTKMGDFIRWIIKDITEEESDTMIANDLAPKDVNKYISSRAREWFFELESSLYL